jgi:hypothetical protein
VPADRLTIGQVLRRFTLGSGPLKRGSDRLQVLARVLLACSLLAAVPISLTAATSSYAQAQDEAAREGQDWHAVPARLTEDVRAPAGDVQDDGAVARGTAVWIDRTGTEHRAVVSVPLGTRAGDTVSVWLDQDGNRTRPPMSASDVTGRAVSQGTGTFTMLAVIACCAYLWVGVLLERSRSRRWEAGWASVEPEWSRRVS